jgi:polyhydroxybutyrate depolymerase
MRTLAPLAVVLLLLLSPSPLRTEEPERRATLRERLIERFDKDGDGEISNEEREAAREAFLQSRPAAADEPPPQRMTWKVAGLEREALVYLPTKTADSAPPLVFGFHGHGGNARQAARSFALHRHWPEAMTVYMQGVPTPGRLTDPEGKRNGWQHDPDELDARDLKFFDAVLATLREKHHFDEDRVYATGHSNGGGFTYLLWASRPGVFAAIAPSAAGSRSIRTTTPRPIPVMHVAGEEDRLVRFSWQERTMERVRAINGCREKGTSWAKGCRLYPSDSGAPFVAFIHAGTHKYPAEAPPLIVRFFKEQTRPERSKKQDK